MCMHDSTTVSNPGSRSTPFVAVLSGHVEEVETKGHFGRTVGHWTNMG